ncbi:MAG: GatB/YqeY domain-containing protein [Bacilli bacterium]
MRNQILEDLTNAMKNQNKEILSVVRMVKGAMQLEEIEKKRILNDEEVISIISKQIKTRKESILDFEKGNRQDLINKTNSEIDILNKYMPKQLSDEEINKEIDMVIDLLKPTSISDMGKIMGKITSILNGKADLSFVSKIVKEKLNNL